MGLPTHLRQGPNPIGHLVEQARVEVAAGLVVAGIVGLARLAAVVLGLASGLRSLCAGEQAADGNPPIGERVVIRAADERVVRLGL
jgi:hypothetical protein